MKCVVLVLVLGLAACRGSKGPTPAPSPVPTPSAPLAEIYGTWTGFLTSSNWSSLLVRATLEQSSSQVTGDWLVVPTGWRGQVRGTVSSSAFTGTLTLTVPGCPQTATGAFSGTASNSLLQWTSPGFPDAGACGLPVNMTLTLDSRTVLPTSPPSSTVRVREATLPAGSTVRVAPMLANGQQATSLWFTLGITSNRDLAGATVQAWTRTPSARCMGGGSAGLTLPAGREQIVVTGSMSNPGGTQPVCALPYDSTHVEVLVIVEGVVLFQQQFPMGYHFVAD